MASLLVIASAVCLAFGEEVCRDCAEQVSLLQAHGERAIFGSSVGVFASVYATLTHFAWLSAVGIAHFGSQEACWLAGS